VLLAPLQALAAPVAKFPSLAETSRTGRTMRWVIGFKGHPKLGDAAFLVGLL
jgi:hypothetical protein